MDYKKEVYLRKDEMILDLQGLLKIPSLKSEAFDKAPFGLEIRKALDYVLDLGQKDGFKIKDVDGYAGVIEWGEGEEILGILGHLDIVPVGTGWTFDPFGATVKDGYIIARGSQDDKGPTIAAYYAMRILKELGYQPKKRVHLIVGCDEESGMTCMDYYNQHAEIPHFGFVPDADFPVIYGEKGILNVAMDAEVNSVIHTLKAGERPNIVIGEAEVKVKGSIDQKAFDFYCTTHQISGSCCEVDGYAVYFFKGKFAHGSRPDEGINAAWHCLNFVGALYDDAFAKDCAYLLSDWRGDKLNIKTFGSHMGYLSMNLGVVSIEDGHAHLVLDIRYPNVTSHVFIMNQIEEALKSKNSPLALSLIQNKDYLFVDPKSKLVSSLESIYREFSQDMVTPLMTMGGGTYARAFKNFVAFGAEFPTHVRPEWVGQVHQADEGYEIEQFLLASAIYAKAIVELTQ